MKLINLIPLEELDINDPALMRYRASRGVNKSDNPMNVPPTRDLTYAKKLKLDMLKAKRAQLMRDMEQEAEPEGGPIADKYGAQLNKIDAAMAKLRGTKDVPYDVAIGRMQEEISDYDMLRSFQKDELLDDLGDIVAKYVKDPDDIDRELDRFDMGGVDAMSNMVTANLLRDPEYQAWAKKFNSIKESNDVRKVIRKIIKEQNFDDRLRSMMGADDFEKATNPKLAKLINNAIMTVDPEMSYVDFAKGVAQVLIDEYGTHNYEPFIKELKKALDSTLG